MIDTITLEKYQFLHIRSIKNTILSLLNGFTQHITHMVQILARSMHYSDRFLKMSNFGNIHTSVLLLFSFYLIK